MPPRADQSADEPTGDIAEMKARTNAETMPDAGKVTIEPGRPWGKGFIEDMRSTVGTYWWEEMTNFNQKTIPVSLLMYITVIAPTLTFGAGYGDRTDENIGAVETILSTAWMGVFFSLFSGMPTVIVGSTGPVLIMTQVLFDMAENMDVPFLTFYAWVSVWTCFYCVFVAFFDLTRYVRLATRFTDDIFALLIVSIFILNAIGSPFGPGGLLRYLDPDNKSHDDFREDLADTNETYSMRESAFLSIILGLGTTATIFWFRGFKTSTFFCNQTTRNLVHDFAVTSAVIVWTLVQQVGSEDVEVQTLSVPNSFEPSFQCCTSACDTFWPDDCEGVVAPVGTRNWFADLFDLNGKGYVPLMAAGPALLAFMLFYLDNGITWHLIYNPENCLQHGESYNWDLFLNGACNLINGMLGLPWLVATTVPCIVHLNNLSDRDEHGRVVKVQENRLTYMFSHMLVGFSLLFLETLKRIPRPVLLGVFLFMGLSSMPGIEFWQRVLLFFKQPDLYPPTPYNVYVKRARVHLFTVLQIGFFLGVFMVQNTPSIAIAFPFMTMLCIPGRLFVVPLFMKGWEMLLLDGEGEQIDEWVALREGDTAIRRTARDGVDADLAVEEEDEEDGDDPLSPNAKPLGKKSPSQVNLLQMAKEEEA